MATMLNREGCNDHCDRQDCCSTILQVTTVIRSIVLRGLLRCGSDPGTHADGRGTAVVGGVVRRLLLGEWLIVGYNEQ